MTYNKSNSIDEILSRLDVIIENSKKSNDPLGYFAVLYQKVTHKVKEGIDTNFFEDNERMERLDIVFADRFLEAYFNYNHNQDVTLSWQKAFNLKTNYWPIVLQHLLMGMNAHISLDLGIASAEIMEGHDIDDLRNDFNKINDILSSLVNEVQENLSHIWPTLKKILKKTKKVDDFLVDFSMEIARDGAWNFAQSIAKHSDDLERLIVRRDQKVSNTASIITKPGLIATVILGIIRLGERGSISERIEQLRR
jgi:hypothetical protein